MTTANDVWVAKTNTGATIYQRPDQTFYVQHADGTTVSVSELVVGRFIVSVVERMKVEETLDKIEAALPVKLPAAVREELLYKIHKLARDGGALRTGSLSTKLIER